MKTLALIALALTFSCAYELDENVGSIEQAGAGVSPFLEINAIGVESTFFIPCVSMPIGLFEAAGQSGLSVFFDLRTTSGESVQASVSVGDLITTRTIPETGFVELEASIDTGIEGLAPDLEASEAQLDPPGANPTPHP